MLLRQAVAVLIFLALTGCPWDAAPGPSGRVDVTGFTPAESLKVEDQISTYLLGQGFVAVTKPADACMTNHGPTTTCHGEFQVSEKSSSKTIEVWLFRDTLTGRLIYTFDEPPSHPFEEFSPEACTIYTALNRYTMSLATPDRVLRGGNVRNCPQYDGVLPSSQQTEPQQPR